MPLLSQCQLVLYHISFCFCSMILLNMIWICFTCIFDLLKLVFPFSKKCFFIHMLCVSFLKVRKSCSLQCFVMFSFCNFRAHFLFNSSRFFVFLDARRCHFYSLKRLKFNFRRGALPPWTPQQGRCPCTPSGPRRPRTLANVS